MTFPAEPVFDRNGRLTVWWRAYLENIEQLLRPPHFRLNLTNTQAMPSGEATVVAFDNVVRNVGVSVDTTAFEVTLPAGVWYLETVVRFTSQNGVDNENLRCFIRKNNSDIGQDDRRRGGTGAFSVSARTLIDFDGDDTTEVVAEKGGAGEGQLEAASSATIFFGFRVALL